MGVRSCHLALFSLCLIVSSGLSTSYDLGTQLDDIPIVNPTTPGTDNPYPTVNQPSPQGPDTTGQNPTTPDTDTTGQNPASSGGQWCVAKQGGSDAKLQTALDYACGEGHADCSLIQPGATCYEPNTLIDHASYAFNDYYQKNPTPTSCEFGGTATLTSTDPSHGNCHYASSKSSSLGQAPPTYVSPPPPTYVSPPSPLNPPMTPAPPDMSNPGDGGSTVYGAEPAGSPNAATCASNSLLLLVTSGLLVSLKLANYI